MDDHTVLNSMVQRGRWVDLGCFMTPGLSKDIRCHVWPYCFKQYGAGRELGGFGQFHDPWSQ